MKMFKFSLLTILLVFAGAQFVSAQSLDEIVSKHIIACGGAENLRNVKTMKMTGKTVIGGTEMPLTMQAIHKEAMKMEMTVGGVVGYMIVTKQAGWKFFPFAGQTKPEPITGQELAQAIEDLDCQGELFDYKEKGTKVTYLGKDDVEGTVCHKLKITKKSGAESTLYLDAKTFLPLREVKKKTADGKESIETSTFGTYKKIAGIVEPMSFEVDGMKMIVDSYEINKPIDESIFIPTK